MTTTYVILPHDFAVALDISATLCHSCSVMLDTHSALGHKFKVVLNRQRCLNLRSSDLSKISEIASMRR